MSLSVPKGQEQILIRLTAFSKICHESTHSNWVLRVSVGQAMNPQRTSPIKVTVNTEVIENSEVRLNLVMVSMPLRTCLESGLESRERHADNCTNIFTALVSLVAIVTNNRETNLRR